LTIESTKTFDGVFQSPLLVAAESLGFEESFQKSNEFHLTGKASNP